VQYQAISTQPGMDIWSIEEDSIDVRISRESEMWLEQLGVHCTIVHDSVELLVQQFEQKLSVQQQEWFEEYVSCIMMSYFSTYMCLLEIVMDSIMQKVYSCQTTYYCLVKKSLLVYHCLTDKTEAVEHV